MALKVPAKFEGNLAADPETKISSRTNKPFVTFTLLETERVRDEAGTYSDGDTNAIDVQVHNEHLARHVLNSLKRGNRVVADGTYSSSAYAKNDGGHGTNHSLVAKNVYASLRFNDVTISANSPTLASSDASADAWADVEIAAVDSTSATLK